MTQEITEIIGNEGRMRFPIIDSNYGTFELTLASWEMIDVGIRIRLLMDMQLLHTLQYELILSKSYFKGMKPVAARYNQNEIFVDLDTNDVQRCNKLDKKIGKTVGSFCLV